MIKLCEAISAVDLAWRYMLVPQFFVYCLNLIFWLEMGSGIARFGQMGPKTLKIWSWILSPEILNGGATLDLEWRQFDVCAAIQSPWGQTSRPKCSSFGDL